MKGCTEVEELLFTPIVISICSISVKAVTSKVGKEALDSTEDQLASSVVNMTADVIKGNNLGESFQKKI